jgi:hypothetical protein
MESIRKELDRIREMEEVENALKSRKEKLDTIQIPEIKNKIMNLKMSKSPLLYIRKEYLGSLWFTKGYFKSYNDAITSINNGNSFRIEVSRLTLSIHNSTLWDECEINKELDKDQEIKILKEEYSKLCSESSSIEKDLIPQNKEIVKTIYEGIKDIISDKYEYIYIVERQTPALNNIYYSLGYFVSFEEAEQFLLGTETDTNKKENRVIRICKSMDLDVKILLNIVNRPKIP